MCLPPLMLSSIYLHKESFADLELSVPVRFKLLGFRMSLSNMLTICPNLGLSLLSFCQQSSISWWSAMGQSIGGGSLQPSSMALITYGRKQNGMLSCQTSCCQRFTPLSARSLYIKLPASLAVGPAPTLSQKPKLDLNLTGSGGGKPAAAVRCLQMTIYTDKALVCKCIMQTELQHGVGMLSGDRMTMTLLILLPSSRQTVSTRHCQSFHRKQSSKQKPCYLISSQFSLLQTVYS